MNTKRLLMIACLVLGVILVFAMVASSCGSTKALNRSEVMTFLNTRFDEEAGQPGTWTSASSVQVTSEIIADRIGPRDSFAQDTDAADLSSEDDAVFMRDGDYIIAVFPDGEGSRIEFDDYSVMRNRHTLFIGRYWGPGFRSYGPNGNLGGDFRGGGPGSGK